MKYFIEKFIENAKLYPDRISLVTVTKKIFTYAELDVLSGRVYAYLKEKNISKEDFVLICLSHSAMAIITMIGIWKAGAAFAIVENNRAPERIDFIKKDCLCKLVIDNVVFEDMMNRDPLSGYEKVDDHDACYAIYTSGSTGTPKGIIHEYGKLAQMIDAADGTMSYCASDDTTRFALVTPLDFAATVTELVPRFYRSHCIYVVSMEIVKNPIEFENYFYENKITDTAMSASLLKTYKNISPFLKTILCTGEASNGVYLKNVHLINKYAMSESLFTVAAFMVDKQYKITPVGKKCLDGVDILILDENDNILPNGSIGEVCFKNEYFRGYINLPEQSEKVNRNGIFHSGDMGYIDENKNLVVSGRKDDMIKINGNRIEPAEIEANIKSVLKINNVIAKGFSDEDRSHIVLYYLNSEAKEIFENINKEKLRQELSKSLPYYMIPTYYMGLDSFPLNQNGKINKKELPKPNVDKMRTTYEAPVNNTEKILCEKIGKVLKVNEVGRNDDFFMIGGDSISAITVVSECNELNLSSQDIYKYRKIAELAQYIDNKSTDVVFNEKMNEKAMAKAQYLLPEQTIIIDRLLFTPKTDMWNIPIYMKLKKDTDIIRFKNALIKVLHNHPVFATKIKVDSDGNFRQYYDEKSYLDIPILDTTENEFEKIKKVFVRPFPLCDSILFRASFYRTETNVYFLFDIHHLICDGTSVTVLLNQIYNCYMDSNYILPVDYYYTYIEYFANKNSQGKNVNEKNAYDKMYENVKNFNSMQGMLNMDHISNECKANDISYDLDIKKEEINGNLFFVAASAIAMAKYNNYKNYTILKWTYNSRDTNDKINMVGLLYNNLPIVVKIDKESDKLEIYKSIEKQIELGIANYEYPYTFMNPYQFENTPILLYQKNTGDFGDLMLLLDEGRIFFDVLKDSNVICALDIFESDLNPNFNMLIHYSSSNYDAMSINRFQKYIVEAAHELEKIDSILDKKVK